MARQRHRCRGPSGAWPASPFRIVLLVVSGGEVREIRLARPGIALDRTYLFLAFVGFLYLLIGLFTVSRERTRTVVDFLGALPLLLRGLRRDSRGSAGTRSWKAFLLTEDIYRALLPALLLHFFLVFPRPLSAGRRRLLPLLYLPGAAYLAGSGGASRIPRSKRAGPARARDAVLAGLFRALRRGRSVAPGATAAASPRRRRGAEADPVDRARGRGRPRRPFCSSRCSRGSSGWLRRCSRACRSFRSSSSRSPSPTRS